MEHPVGTPGHVHKTPSEEDIIIAGKLTHVHGKLAKQECHPPQHHDPSKLNYAHAAAEEMHDVATHPPHASLFGKPHYPAREEVKTQPGEAGTPQEMAAARDAEEMARLGQSAPAEGAGTGAGSSGTP